jgi:hypothetical protein
MSDEVRISVLRRVEAGDSADWVYAEEYANAEHKRIEGD